MTARKRKHHGSNLRGIALVVVAGFIIASCSRKPVPERNQTTIEARPEAAGESEAERDRDERQPDEDKIAEDCITFVGSTKVMSASPASSDCPTCPPAGTDVLSFRRMKTESISCSGDTCTVVVTIGAAFNPGAGEKIAGGLTAWIPPEQQTAYLSGQTLAAENMFRVQITYKHRSEGWRAVEFDRASVR